MDCFASKWLASIVATSVNVFTDVIYSKQQIEKKEENSIMMSWKNLRKENWGVQFNESSIVNVICLLIRRILSFRYWEHVESGYTYWFSSKGYETCLWTRLFDQIVFNVCLGTRFRPLSLEIPKPLFPIAGFPILYHLIESCAQVIEHFPSDCHVFHHWISSSVTWITWNSSHWMLSTQRSSISFYC